MPCILQVRVNPRSSSDRIVLDGETVKVWVTAPPADGEANAAVIKTLAKKLRVPPSSIEILKGATGRNKMVSIEGLDESVAKQRLAD